MLVSFGIAAAPGKPCFSLEYDGSGGVLSHERLLALLANHENTRLKRIAKKLN